MTLTITKINKTFGEKHVLKNVSFSVASGKALGYLGRNGAGKTTTIRILTDIFRADSGEVLLDGAPINYATTRIGYLPEERGLYPKSKVADQMTYIGELRGMSAAAAKKAALVLLQELEAEEYWSKKLETLSKGNQQKIQLAIAVLHNPDIIILDEPFSGLDPVNSSLLKKMIMKEVALGKIVMFSSHQMPYVEEFCEDICILNQGEIVINGKIRDIKRTYPRNKIFVGIPTDTNGFIAAISAQPNYANLIAHHETSENGVIFTLRNADDKNGIFTLLPLISNLSTANIDLDRMQIVEPTLEEIFVEKAGDTP